MQTREGLRRVAREFVQDLGEDGVVYGEVRWAPEQHLGGGLSLDETVDAVQEGIEEGIADVRAAGGRIRVGQLVTAMRHNDRGLEIAELAVRHRDRGVVGFDIAGPEAGFPASNHRAAFDYLAPARRTAWRASGAPCSTVAPCVSGTACDWPRTSRSSGRTTRTRTSRSARSRSG
jgi:adenosine deaminase